MDNRPGKRNSRTLYTGGVADMPTTQRVGVNQPCTVRLTLQYRNEQNTRSPSFWRVLELMPWARCKSGSID